MKDGQSYAPQGKPAPVVKPGEFVFAAAHLDHGHIYGQCNGLIEAGGELHYVYDPDPAKVAAFVQKYPQAKPVDRIETLLDDPAVHLVAAAAVPCDRGPLGCRVLESGKDYFTDKTPFTTLDQLATARATVARTGRKYMVYFSERLHVECAVFAGQLIAEGAIGQVIEVVGFGPHRLGDPASRPAWFYEKAKYGGILCDIGSHQFEQFLHYTGATDATVLSATVANKAHPEFPELEDFAEAHLLGNNGTTNFIRVDWLTPAASRTWGDGRMFIQGTKGYMELRKYIEVGRDEGGDQLYLVNDHIEKRYSLAGQVGFPFFGQLVLDCLNRTETAMTQAHAFKAAELCLQAQAQAKRLD
jgi:predicted dehydrogenase